MVFEKHLEGRVGECVAHPLESCRRLINVVRIPVWVMDQSETTVGTLDLLSCSTLANPQGLVVVECWCGRHRANSHFRTDEAKVRGSSYRWKSWGKQRRTESSSLMKQQRETDVERKCCGRKTVELERRDRFLGD
jgi:hypothetical protein